MIIVDTAIARHVAAGKPPIRVGMIGAGFMASGVMLQIGGPYRDSIQLAAISARTPAKAAAACEAAGLEHAGADSAQALARAVEAGRTAITEDAMLVATSPHVDVLLDVTGAVEDAIAPVLAALEHGKHVLLMNPELDGTLGPLFKHKADKAGVVFTDVDGDQPGVIGNLHRFIKGLGVRPVLLGNIKGLQDPYRNPTTQKGFAEKWGQNPYLVTSFADGTKVSFEMTVAANASGMTVARRGMHGYTFEPGTPIMQAAKSYDADEILSGPGIVDYVVGCEPGPGVWALGTIEHPRQRHYLNLYKLGEGPLYCFYTPYHLCHFEVPVTIARAALLGDAAITPMGAPQTEVLATPKRDLKAGEEIDALGGYTVYGEAEAADVTARENLLPIGVAVGCKLKHDVPKDRHLTYDDVEIPPGRLVDKLRAEQDALFGIKRGVA